MLNAFNSFRSSKPEVRIALRVMIYYTVFSLLWIFFSDSAIESLAKSKNQLTTIQTLKGTLFVILSGLLVFALVYFSTVKRFLLERKIGQVEKHYEQVFRNSSDAIVITDMNYRVLLCNTAAVSIFRYSESDLQAKDVFTLFSEEQKQELLPLFEQKHESIPKKKQIYCHRSDGALIPAEVSVSVLETDEGGRQYGVIIRDRTYEQKVQDRLLEEVQEAEELNTLKSNFVATISHELRTPLIGIMGFSEMMQTESTEPLIQGWAERIQLSGKRLLNTLNALIDLSRIEAKDHFIAPNEILVQDFIDELFSNHKPEADRKGLAFTASVQPENLTVHTDEAMLSRILNSITENAIKYTERGKVTIMISEVEDEKIKISVEDTGIGMSEKEILIVFEDFRQASEGYSRLYEGTGLGLSLAKRFVSLLSGTISVDSQPHLGSIFTVVIPKRI